MTTESSVPVPSVGGPELPQERRVVTEIPGPSSQALHARRAAAVASGVGSVLPVYVAAAGGGVVVDVDGNSLIDLASGIAVTSVGNSAPKVVQRVQEQVAAYTHTCFMVAPYEGYVEVCEKLASLTPGDSAKKMLIRSWSPHGMWVCFSRIPSPRITQINFGHGLLEKRMSHADLPPDDYPNMRRLTR